MIRCCYIDKEHKRCENEAIYGTCATRKMYDETESCIDHLGKLLSDEPVHYVYHL